MNATFQKKVFPRTFLCSGALAFKSGFEMVRWGDLLWVAFNSCFLEQLNDNFAVRMLLNLTARSFWGCSTAHMSQTHWLPVHFLFQLLWKQRRVGHCGQRAISRDCIGSTFHPSETLPLSHKEVEASPPPLWIWAGHSDMFITTRMLMPCCEKSKPN